jgi:hypothetical protein
MSHHKCEKKVEKQQQIPSKKTKVPKVSRTEARGTGKAKLTVET